MKKNTRFDPRLSAFIGGPKSFFRLLILPEA